MAPVVVFDTNVLLSAIGWHGRPGECLDRARHGQVSGATSEALLDELCAKMTTKLAFSEEQIADTLADLLSFLRIVPTPEALSVITADPDDDRVLECAVAAGATMIVSGDRRHLLPLGSFRGIVIVRPSEFLTLVPEP